jgi:retron-type reverse transcriptase
MKRVGQLFDSIANEETLLAAYHRAAIGKRNHKGTFCFSRNLGAQIRQLAKELSDGDYQPHPCNRFWVHDGPKPRLIEAPSFRDLVVQHAVFSIIGPIFERRYIANNYACRKGKGTHKAADWLQSAMRNADRSAWVFHVDVRKFFYTIDREVLKALLSKTIKCTRTLELMMLFAQRPEPTGVPIGNLLSQTFANVYLHSLDSFCKRGLKVKQYARYMDDSIMITPDRATGEKWLSSIRSHLGALSLEISHYSLQPIKRGANFVGFRTWRRGRFVRPHVITSFRRDAQRGHLPGIVSRLGHAKYTCSHQPMINFLKENHADIHRQIQKIL